MAKARLNAADGDDPVALLKQEVQRIYARQAKKDADVVDAMDRFADFTKEQLAELDAMPPDQLRLVLASNGFSLREFQIARKARLPKSKVPFALLSAHERNMARIRRTEDAPGATRIGIAIMNLPPRAERQDNERVVVIEATEVKG